MLGVSSGTRPQRRWVCRWSRTRISVRHSGLIDGVAECQLVTRIMVMSETLPLANVKSKFSEMVDRVEHTHDRIIVTRNGRPAAVLISPEELESLEDTRELLSDPDAMRQLAESRQAYAAGDFVTGEELRGRYLTK